MLSDSILDNPPTGIWLKRDLEESFISINAFAEFEIGGGRIRDGLGALSFETYIPDILAAQANVVVLFAGTNDAGNGGDDAVFTTDYLDHLADLLTGGGHRADLVVCCTALTRNNAVGSEFTTQINNVNSRINALPAAFDAANPAYAGRVVVADTFNSIGGHAAPASYFSDGIHLGFYGPGMEIVIQCIADRIAQAQS